jgi:hypothetical protein
MATVKHAIAEHDFVALREKVGKWPAGTTGTVVSDYGNVKLVEVSEDRPPGQMLDLIQVPEADMRLITRHSRP